VNEALPEKVQLPGEVKLHHIGFVVDSIEESAVSLAMSLGASWDKNVICDAVQKVKVTFLKGHYSPEPMIELVEPAGPDSPVSRFVERGGGLHHVCYEVEDLEAHLAYCKKVRTICIRQPVPAVAFGGRRIAWAITPKRLLVEFLER